MTDPARYRLSFTVGGLFLDVAPTVAEVHQEVRDWSQVRSKVEAENLLQARTLASSKRMSREVVQRLSSLSDLELAVVVDGTATERGHVLWVAVCRAYPLLAEFVQEVVAERLQRARPQLAPADFTDFAATKALWHPELAELRPSTEAKLRTNTFLMLRQAGLLSEDGAVNGVLPSRRVVRALVASSALGIAVFPGALSLPESIDPGSSL